MKFFYSLIKWLIGIVLGLPLIVYLLLILLNISDDDKSDKVIEFEQFMLNRATVDDKGNGFVYAAGLSASSANDFYLAGVEKIKQANRITSLSATPLATSEQEHWNTSKETFHSLVAGCGDPIKFNEACNTYLLGKTEEIDKFLTDSKILIHRYEIMTSQRYWYESIQANVHNYLSVLPWFHGHKVFMLNVWREATKGNVDTVTLSLQQDSVFWRNTMISTHSLLHFSMTTILMQQNYLWGSFALKNFSVNEVPQTMPDDWHRSLIETPFSFDNIVIGEWQFANAIFQDSHDSDDWFSVFMKPLFNLQSTLNLYAEKLIESAQSKQNNLENSTVISNCQKTSSPSVLYWYSYNPIGKLFVCVGGPTLKAYENRILIAEEDRLAAIAFQQVN